jgi:hypothetical protein
MTLGPHPVPLAAACDGAGQYGGSAELAPFFYLASADGATDFGPAIPLIGNVVVATSATADSEDVYGVPAVGGSASGSASGSVTYYFAVTEIRTPPSAFVPKVYFQARASGSAAGDDVNGFNSHSFQASARLPAAMATAWSLGGTSQSQFDQWAYFDLPANDPLVNPSYSVTISANCSVTAGIDSDPFGLRENNAWAGCQAAIDPTIRLAQEAFDAAYGASAFPLADYYGLEFSENVVIPEPAPAPLLAAVLLALFAVARHRNAS